MSQPLRLQNPFVGRAREQKAYLHLLEQTTPWLLVITGDGGIGKSALLRHLYGQTPRGIQVVLLNFANDKLRIDPLNILEELSWQLAAHCDEKRVVIFEQTLAEGRDKLSEAIKAMSQQVIVGDGGSAKDVQVDMGGYSASAMREQRRQVRESVTRAFYGQLMTYKPSRLALMLDTCEWLSELEGLEVGKWAMDELLPAIHERLTYSHRLLSVVIASRVPPPLTVIERPDRWSLSLPRLDAEAVHLYLQQIGMQDTAMRQRVYEITQGHALCISIIGVLWQEQGDQPFTQADLPQLRTRFTEKALVEYIRERLSERLKPPYRDLTRYGVLLRSFDLPMLQAVFPELLSNVDALDVFHQLNSYPYVEQRDHHYAFHDLLREIQAAEVRTQQPTQWKMYHQRALDYLSKQIPRPADWYYHAIACDEAQGIDEWWEVVQDPRHNGTAYLAALFEAAYDVTLELSSTQSAHRVFKLGRFYSSAYGAKMDAAVGCYEEALSLYRQVGDRLGEANVRKAMGDVQQFRDEREAALASYEQALGLFRQVGDRLGEANCYLAQGRVARQQEDFQSALTLQTRAYKLYQDIHDQYDQAVALYYRSFVFESMQEREQAIEDIETSLAIAIPLDLPFVDLLRERQEKLRQP
ncbi:MAG TPA: tetratricopeptide repeat protein [Ktedonobacteraceae bacterium]|nr:tetratricopeptide repeat protein [Ktedonobacteraceae bacterium]